MCQTNTPYVFLLKIHSKLYRNLFLLIYLLFFIQLGYGEKAGSGADYIIKGAIDNKWHIPALVEHVQPDTVSLYLYLNDVNDTSLDINDTSLDANDTSLDANDTSLDANDTSLDANDTSYNEPSQRLAKDTLINIVLELCEDWITIDEISEKTGKRRQYLRGRIIPAYSGAYPFTFRQLIRA